MAGASNEREGGGSGGVGMDEEVKRKGWREEVELLGEYVIGRVE